MNELYSSEERSKLDTFTTTYNNAIADYASKKANAENLRQQFILHPQFTQLGASATLAEATAEAAKQFAAQAKIDMDDYQRFLNSKYQQSFIAQHPELAPTLTQIATQGQVDIATGQANADSATQIALGLGTINAAKGEADAAAQAEADKAKKNKMYMYIGFGVAALIIGFLIYKQSKKTS